MFTYNSWSYVQSPQYGRPQQYKGRYQEPNYQVPNIIFASCYPKRPEFRSRKPISARKNVNGRGKCRRI